MKPIINSIAGLLALLIMSCTVQLCGDDAPSAAPKFLFDEKPEHSEGKIDSPSQGVSATIVSGGIDVMMQGSDQSYPGFSIVPSKNEAWDLSPWGHVKAKITNTSDHKITVNMRIDNKGKWQDNPWNTESVSLNPGESKYIKVIFGYQYGYKAGFKLNPAAVVRVLFFCGKSKNDRSFRVEEIHAGGPAGEKPPVDPASIVVCPEGGMIIGEGSKLSPQPKLKSKNLVLAKYNEIGVIDIESEAGKDGVLNIIPSAGVWHLGFFNEVNVAVKNTGVNPVSVSGRIESKGKKFSDRIFLESINSGEEKLITVPFIPAKSWVGEWNSDKKHGGAIKGTGTEFESNKTCGIEITIGKNDESSRFQIISVIATAKPIVIPDWVGKKPPVEGNWKLTFEDNFDGDTIDLQKWNIYSENYWDKRTHFTKENVIVKDGFLILRYEKKTGFHNDDPEDKSPVAKTDFACGFADSYGKWTQRYGYFEARMKLPTCPGLWPAFWTMPDRGGNPDPKVNPQWKRASTHNDGMEFDIMEHLTAWGPYRFNCAFHWDGYQKEHKSIGASNVYVKADKDGFFTVGMLWLPGFVAYYANGVEFARWENERICNVQSYPIFYMVSGGWANLPLDQSQLPADFVIDYIRVWQRDDLASPEDGFKPNEGNPRSQF